MLIHEYQARDLFKEYGIPVTDRKVFESLDGVEEYAKELGEPVVVKAQVHAGGRGKGGGVKFAPTPADALEHAKNILGMQLITHQTGAEGVKVNKIMLVPAADIAKEFYLAITISALRPPRVSLSPNRSTPPWARATSTAMARPKPTPDPEF